MILENIKIFDGNKELTKANIQIKDGKIHKITNEKIKSETKKIDCSNLLVAPGYIDLQINGINGVLLNNDISLKTLQVIQESSYKYGCTSCLPTLITTSRLKIVQTLKIFKENIKQLNEMGILGLHLEGPIISDQKSGTHSKKYITKLDNDLLNLILKNQEIIRKITIAPEMISKKQLEMLAKTKIILSIGHTNATYNQLKNKEKYFQNGTHLFNAMSQNTSRELGTVGFLMHNKTKYCSIICDGIHVDYKNIELANNQLKNKLYIITDSVTATGNEKIKQFKIENILVYVKNKKCINENNDLAGANITMEESVKNLIKNTNLNKEQILKMSSNIQAKLLKMNNKIGKIKENYIADLVILNKEYEVAYTIKKGKIVYEKNKNK